VKPVLFACVLAVFAAGCGKKGPPLPPLVKLPAAPANLSAERRGDDVRVQFTVPATNTDNSKPANVERVDVYAYTGSPNVRDEDLLKHGTKIGSVPVKAPRDPNNTAEEDESADDVDAPEGKGLDQGAIAHVDDKLTAASRIPADAQARDARRPRGGNRDAPLVGPSTAVATRIYAGVGISTKGRHGPLSKRVAVPLVKAPPAPPRPTVTYNESAITVAWPEDNAPQAGEPLPSHPLGVSAPTFAYNVYEVPSAPTSPPTDAAAAAAAPGETRLTKSPITDHTFSDPRMDWGKERCYVVRAIESLGELNIESPDSAPGCATLEDTYPPAPPKNLQAVASEGAISLIWDASSESDLAGYLVLRGTSTGSLAPITSAPIADTNFKDTVPSGVRYTYAVIAVDKYGNKSGRSNTVDETARD
jgi:predicted small lipoprotein YifL